ncbi:MAG: hypothetical protein V7641_3527 [Blastocatellia bacterium]
MNFLLTSYFWPLASPITLSNHLKFSFDNPRTKPELDYARQYLKDLYESKKARPLPIHSEEDIVSLETILVDFRDTFSERDEYIREFLASYKRKNIFSYFAKMWIVARFDDEGEVARITRRTRANARGWRAGFDNA